MTQSGDNDLFSQAQEGRELIERAILGLLAQNAGGLTNAEVARQLGLMTGMKTGQKNYLTWSILKELVARGAVGTNPKQKGTGALYVATDSSANADQL